MNRPTRPLSDLVVTMGRFVDTTVSVTANTKRGRDALNRKTSGGDIAPSSVLVRKSAIDAFVADTGCTVDYRD